MGRRGHQAKKRQGIPEIPPQLRDEVEGKRKKLSSRAKSRQKKRQFKTKLAKIRKQRDRSIVDDEEGDFVTGHDAEIKDDDSDSALEEGAKMESEKPIVKDAKSKVNGKPTETADVSGESENTGDGSPEEEAAKVQLFADQSDLDDDSLVRESRELEERERREQEEGDLEFQMNVRRAGERILDLDGEMRDGLALLEGEDPAQVLDRITEIVRILLKFSELRDPAKSRSEYIDRLKKDIKNYYGYNDFMVDRIVELFPPSELLDFLNANESPRPVTIRVNLLAITPRDLHKSLATRGMNIDRIEGWTKVGLQVLDSKVAIGATPEYVAGAYIVQAAASFLPVMALDARENEQVLDMCASPGGKTTHIAMCMKNTGVIVANDINKDRCKALMANVHRMGVHNVVVSNLDARKFPKMLCNFDRVLVDAPCTGTGVASKDPAVKMSKTEKDLSLLTHTQKELILSAADCTLRSTSSNGVIVYSTCSILVEENEEIIDYLLKKRPNIQLEDTGLQIGVPAFSSYRGKSFSKTMKLARRVYPHTHNLDGFFVAKLRKVSTSPGTANSEENSQYFQNFESCKGKSKNASNSSSDSGKKASIKTPTKKRHKKSKKESRPRKRSRTGKDTN